MMKETGLQRSLILATLLLLLAGHPNVFAFDLFDLLADGDDVLRAEYRMDEYDSHPNELANRTIGPLFADFIDQAVRSYTPR